MNRPAHSPSHTAAHSAHTASGLLGARPRRAVGLTAGALAALALGRRSALASQDGADAGPLAEISLSYSDTHGPGLLMVTPLGADEATGGTAVSVHLAQARGPFAGSGFVRQIEGQGYLFAATVGGVAGAPGGPRESYFLAGTLRREGSGWRGNGRWSALGDASLAGEWHAAEWPAIQPPRPQLTASVHLAPTGQSTVTGTTTLVALPNGETRFELHLSGLTPGAVYGVQLRAGTPAQPSASFTQIIAVTADQRGRSGADGLLRFRDTEPIALLDIADGDHFLSVVSAGQTVASGAIPAVRPLG